MGRSNISRARRMQIVLSEVRHCSRVVTAMWGSIWPEPGTFYIPTEPDLERAYAVFETDHELVTNHSGNAEVGWAGAFRKDPSTYLASLRRLNPSKRMQSLTRQIRDNSPIQTASLKKTVNRTVFNSSVVRPPCGSSIAVLMAVYSRHAIGLTSDSTVDWVFFKDAVDDVRASVAIFKPNEVALQKARVRTKPLVNQIGEEHYNSEDSENEMIFFNLMRFHGCMRQIAGENGDSQCDFANSLNLNSYVLHICCRILRCGDSRRARYALRFGCVLCWCQHPRPYTRSGPHRVRLVTKVVTNIYHPDIDAPGRIWIKDEDKR
jgi:hypothetical protein